jgi:Zn-dependent protease with chaperone function
MTPSGRALGAVAVFAVVPAVIIAVILGLTAGWLVGLIGLVVVGAAAATWARLGGDRVISARLDGRPPDARADARFVNLVEGLCTAAGIRQPRLVVVDSPGLNALAAGSSPAKSVLAVTSALLAELDRMELEAVLAEEIWLIRHERTGPGTVLAATFGMARGLISAGASDSAADQGAISLTRYPPALASALEKIEAKGASVAGQPAFLSSLWLADPRSSASAGSGRLPLSERIEALREL